MPAKIALAPEKTVTERIVEYLFTPEGKDATNVQLAARFACNDGTAARARKKYEEARDFGVEEEIAHADLCTDYPTQQRPGLDPEHLARLTEWIALGRPYEPVSVVRTPEGEAIPWDGFHTISACADLGHDLVRCRVRPGTARDAVLLSVRANATHGLNRDKETMRNSVLTLLRDDEWSKMSPAAMAEAAGVTPDYVARVRASYRDDPEARDRDGVLPEPDALIGLDGRSRPARRSAQLPHCGSQTPPEDDGDGETCSEDTPGAPPPSANGHTNGHVAPKETERQRQLREAKEYAEALPVYSRLAPPLRHRLIIDCWFQERTIEARSQIGSMLREAEKLLGTNSGGAPLDPYLAQWSYTERLPAPAGGEGDKAWLACSDCRGKDGLSTGRAKGSVADCGSCGGAGFHVPGLKR